MSSGVALKQFGILGRFKRPRVLPMAGNLHLHGLKFPWSWILSVIFPGEDEMRRGQCDCFSERGHDGQVRTDGVRLLFEKRFHFAEYLLPILWSWKYFHYVHCIWRTLCVAVRPRTSYNYFSFVWAKSDLQWNRLTKGQERDCTYQPVPNLPLANLTLSQAQFPQPGPWRHLGNRQSHHTGNKTTRQTPFFCSNICSFFCFRLFPHQTAQQKRSKRQTWNLVLFGSTRVNSRPVYLFWRSPLFSIHTWRLGFHSQVAQLPLMGSRSCRDRSSSTSRRCSTCFGMCIYISFELRGHSKANLVASGDKCWGKFWFCVNTP